MYRLVLIDIILAIVGIGWTGLCDWHAAGTFLCTGVPGDITKSKHLNTTSSLMDLILVRKMHPLPVVIALVKPINPGGLT